MPPGPPEYPPPGGTPGWSEPVPPTQQQPGWGAPPPGGQPSGGWGAPPPGAPPSGGFGAPPPGGGFGGPTKPPGNNQPLIIVIVVLVVAALAGVAFLLTSGGDDDDDTASSTTLGTGDEGTDPGETTLPSISVPDVTVTVPDIGSDEAGPPEPPPGGGDATLTGLADDCYNGDMQACDDLFLQTEAGSELEDYGDTCGKRFDVSHGFCTTAISDPILP